MISMDFQWKKNSSARLFTTAQRKSTIAKRFSLIYNKDIRQHNDIHCFRTIGSKSTTAQRFPQISKDQARLYNVFHQFQMKNQDSATTSIDFQCKSTIAYQFYTIQKSYHNPFKKGDSTTTFIGAQRKSTTMQRFPQHKLWKCNLFLCFLIGKYYTTILQDSEIARQSVQEIR